MTRVIAAPLSLASYCTPPAIRRNDGVWGCLFTVGIIGFGTFKQVSRAELLAKHSATGSAFTHT